ncbi:MAG TPA: MXAN_6640 family putative metalloprotease, partial [candidate division Zixibacteria bacterium]|nr:MXAN_6640 family putative metalloprotease [candidate division Zixibacteria bacterium]
FLICMAIITVSANAADPLPRDRQEELVNYYKFVTEGKTALTGEAQSSIGLDSLQLPLKCATPIVASYVTNFNRLDKDLVERHSLDLQTRPSGLNESYDSPANLFKVHFSRTGTNAVYQPTVTTGGIPNYVINVARIFDSVYAHIIDTLGFPKPPSDGGYPSGVDSLYDVYLRNLGGNFFGLTYPDSLFFSGGFSLDATSFVVIDNDYQESSFGQYNSQPLNAVRVTAAHEFFHAVHFAIDISEAEDYTDSVLQRRYWYEMSAVWMEEEIYDDINDYYTVLPFFFNRPRSSIQQFASFFDFHPYASAVFPIFLTEKFGRDIIKPIWIRCGTLGLGPHFLEAAQLVIDSASGGTENWRSVFGEFTLWNYFTGTRANLTPPGVTGYSERAFYPPIPDTAFSQVYQYPVNVPTNANPKNPTANSAAYLRLNNIRGLFYTDSADTQLRVSAFFGQVISDSALPQGWHVCILPQSDADTTIYSLVDTTFPDNTNRILRTFNPRDYRTVNYIFTPASWKWQTYTSSNYDTRLGYIVTDSLALLPNKPTVIFAPYPNPADVRSMNGENLKFRFQIATDAQAFQSYLNPYTVIDFYTSAGELVRTFENSTPPALIDPISGTIRYELEWDMRSASGDNVAPGVYVCLVRMFDSSDRGELLAEEKTKVLIVR